MHTLVLLQAAPTSNDLTTLTNNVVNVLLGPGLGLVALSFIVAGILYCLSPVNEHVAMRGRALIAAGVIGGIVMLGARNWANLVRLVTPGAGGS
jgi:hypothetical protein